MKLLLFSDIHADWKALESLLAQEADYYVAAGDLSNWAKNLDRAGEILMRRSGKVWVIPGNHESGKDITEMCDAFGLENVHGKSWTMNGIQFAALGYSNLTPFDTPGEFTEEELTKHLDILSEPRPGVLICHCPPHGTTLDEAGPGKHFGSPAITKAIARMQPRYFFCGHIHEAAGREEVLGQTIARNLGKKGYLLNLETSLAA
jgi:Icc-related predicted phosphoesterase